MRTPLSLALPLFFLSLLGAGCQNVDRSGIGDSVYWDGTILTMEDDMPEVEAVVVKEGKILFAGSAAEAKKHIDGKTSVHSLAGKTLMPGFIDAHGHLTSRAGMMHAVDLSPSPYGTVNSIKDLQLKLKESEQGSPSDSPIIGNGYDDAIMIEHRHPSRKELDAVSLTRPILVIHASGHASVANSAMLGLLGIDENVKDPEGGHYGRDNAHRLNGKLEENANFMALIALMEKADKEKAASGKGNDRSAALADLAKAQDEWLSYGQTTICDGRTMGESLDLLREAADKHLLIADVVYFPDYEYFKDRFQTFLPEYMKYKNRLKLGGFKFSDDGSPQGKTAWLTQPYLTPPEGKGPHYKGFPIFSDSQLYQDLKQVFQHKVTAQLHVNGDAAIDQALSVIQRLKAEGIYDPSLRATLIHVQNSRPDHIQKIKDIGLIPSYFSTHAYLWGDWYYSNVFGPQRSAFISPAGSALKAGIRFSIHHDAPVTPPDLMTAVYAAVNRKTRSGRTLGPDERISTLEALKAITINAAYQYHEEESKGSIKKDKLADLVILDRNPLKTTPEDLKDIVVLATIKEGKTVFKRSLPASL